VIDLRAASLIEEPGGPGILPAEVPMRRRTDIEALQPLVRLDSPNVPTREAAHAVTRSRDSLRRHHQLLRVAGLRGAAPHVRGARGARTAARPAPADPHDRPHAVRIVQLVAKRRRPAVVLQRLQSENSALDVRYNATKRLCSPLTGTAPPSAHGVAIPVETPPGEVDQIHLGTALAGSTVELRLRIGTDPGVSDVGWEIDQIAVEGIINTPFPAWAPDAAACNPPPIADAGPDQLVAPDTLVTLDGSASADPDGDPITYAWAQVSGPTVTLDAPLGVGPGFTAPRFDEPTALVFQLTVADGAQSAVDEVEVLVDAYVPEPVDDTGGDDGADGDPVEPEDGGDGGEATADGGADGGTPTDTGGAAATGGGAKDEGGGCGCASGPRQGLGLAGLLTGLLGVVWRRRR
jgi:hypothetical protein